MFVLCQKVASCLLSWLYLSLCRCWKSPPHLDCSSLEPYYLSVWLLVGIVHLTVCYPPPTACYSGLMRANESSLPPPHPFPSCSSPAQPKQRPTISLIIKSNGQDSGPVWVMKPAHGGMRFQYTSASVGPVWTANYCWLMLYYFTTKDRCREKGRRRRKREGCEGGGGRAEKKKFWKGA